MAQPEPDRYVVWDATLAGFGLRVDPTGRKTFILRYRPRMTVGPAPKRFMTIGRYGPLTVDQARDQAAKHLGAVAVGEDPARRMAERRAEKSLAEAAEEFLKQHVDAKRKPATQASYRHALERHIIPRLGERRLTEISKSDVARLHSSLSATPAVANYAVAALGSLYSWAARLGHVPDEFNPTRRLEKFPERPRERYLTSEELRRLGDTLRKAETRGLPWRVDETRPTAKHAPKIEKRVTIVSPFATAAIRLLLFTGCRLNEVLRLRWRDVDFERRVLFLPDSKTGRRTILLGAPALNVLRALPRMSEYVIAGVDANSHLTGLKRPWNAVRQHAELEGVRLHDLRHSYASVGAAAGLGLPIIGRLLGHTQASTTARYAHLADDPLRRASDAIAETIESAMNGTRSSE